MANDNLTFKKSVAKDLRAIPHRDVKRLLECRELLRKHPRAGLKLSGQERYRVRQGTYRVIYEIHEQDFLILNGFTSRWRF